MLFISSICQAIFEPSPAFLYNLHMMSDSLKLFQDLSSLKQQESFGESAESKLLAYCTNVLGSVERFHFDYKEKRDRRIPSLEDDDKKILPKQSPVLPILVEAFLFGEWKTKSLSRNRFLMSKNFCLTYCNYPYTSRHLQWKELMVNG